MINHDVRVYPSAARLPREAQLAWKLAAFATAEPPLDPESAEMVRCRIVDNAAVAHAAINRAPVAAARAQALAQPRPGGAAVYGLPVAFRAAAEWAAWANATAVRELDFHDTFLAQEFGHPGDNIAPLLAVAQQCRCGGEALVRGIVIAYEVHIALLKAISLHQFKKDHLAHLSPGAVAGIGAMLGLPTETVFQAINQAVHLSFSTRQSRKGELSSWKAFVPAFSGKLAIEAVDRAMRGQNSPSPIYEGEDSVIAWMLGGPQSHYTVALPDVGEAPRGIIETYTKAHSAEYQAQAMIDLAFEMRRQVDISQIEEVVVHTSAHTHQVIGTGANDPQKFDPTASRETLDHSLPYILAVALEDGVWHHERSYARERANRPETVELWQKIRTVENADWNARYHERDPSKRAFGGGLEIVLRNGEIVRGEKAVADAHPNGKSPWSWNDYVGKFDALSVGLVNNAERDRFLAAVTGACELEPVELTQLHCSLQPGRVVPSEPTGEGILDFPRE